MIIETHNNNNILIYKKLIIQSEILIRCFKFLNRYDIKKKSYYK